MSDFNFAIRRTLEYEGGFVVDHAGPTNRGVVLRALKEMGAWGDFDRDGDVDETDLRNMTEAQAIEFYRLRYWIPGGWGRIVDNMIGWKCFDLHVNMGQMQAGIILQRALNRSGRCVTVDGLIGAITIRETNLCDPALLIGAMRVEARKVYDRIIIANPNFEKYRAGWYARADG